MRYELTDFEWAAIKPFLPNEPRGVPRVNDRRVSPLLEGPVSTLFAIGSRRSSESDPAIHPPPGGRLTRFESRTAGACTSKVVGRPLERVITPR